MSDWLIVAAQLGFQLNSAQVDQFDAYLALLLAWTRRINLTAVREPDLIQQRHFLDSLTCSRAIKADQKEGFSLIDVGTGAGFPGIPLKIFYPHLSLTLVESIEKKARFLERIVTDLGLADVEIVAGRAETLGQMVEYREQFDWAAARAVAEMRVLAEYLLPFCRVGGHALAQKGPSAREEATTAQNSIAVLGGSKPDFLPVALPGRNSEHYLVLVEKVAATPNRFPRRPGIPKKRPL